MLCLMLCAALMGGCVNRPYPDQLGSIDALRARAATQGRGPVRVSAAVPNPSETRDIFHLPLYDRGVQPIWVEIDNQSDDLLRFAPTSVDPEYFAPLEVAFGHRRGRSRDARRAMNVVFHDAQMPRYIQAGEVRSGFIFSHVEPGTKGFNIDLFGPGRVDYRFTFFVDVPGFVPDHAQIDFASLYDQEKLQRLGHAGLREAIGELPFCTSSANVPEGNECATGLPVNLILIARNTEILGALLRAGWRERPAGAKADPEGDQKLFGRGPDAVFRLQRSGAGERNELRMWLSPYLVCGDNVWLAQITHYAGLRKLLGAELFQARLDPDIDEARSYMMQLMWYSHGLKATAWSSTGNAVPLPRSQEGIMSTRYFTDGYRAVLWLSGPPVSIVETIILEWDDQPRR